MDYKFLAQILEKDQSEESEEVNFGSELPTKSS